jgi:DNA-binding SARP family transcriptional activator
VRVEFEVLGDMRVRVDGRFVDPGPARQRTVLAALLLAMNTVVGVDQLVDRVWTNRAPQRAREGVYTYVSRLRRLGVRLERRSGGYLLAGEPDTVDLHRFRSLTTRARSTARSEDALRLLTDALDLWRGDPFANLDAPWLLDVRQSLEADRLAAERDRADVALRLGRHAELLPELRQQAATHPLDERLAGQLMLALYRSGKQADALAHYQRLRHDLAESLGVDPMADLRRLHVALLSGEDPADDDERPVPFQLPPMPPLVVGRKAEVAQLVAATSRPGAVSVIEGAGGAGKSTLALYVAHRVASQFAGGCLYANLGGRAAPVEATVVMATFLRALGAPTVPTDPHEASALFRTWSADRGVLVVLDNAASAAQVRPLIPSGLSCVTIITSRWALSELDVTVRLRLAPLPDTVASALLARLVGAERVDAEPDAVAAIVRRCGGLPLALRIAAARAVARPDTSLTALAERLADETRRLDVLEVGDLSVRASLHLGYRAFADAPHGDYRRAGRLFRLCGLADWAHASVHGCAALADLPLSTTERGLELLTDGHLLQPTGGGRYRFHDIVRLYARERAVAVDPEPDREAALSRLTRWLLSTAATAARLLYPQDRLPSTATGDQSEPLASTTDARNWFERERTNLLLLARQRVAAGRSLGEVRDLALLTVKFTDYSGYVAEQLQFGELAVDAAQRLGDRSGTAAARNIVAVTMLRMGRLDEGIDLLRRILVTVRELGDRSREAACLNNLGNALRDRGDLAGALTMLQAALALRREQGERYREGSVLDNLALVYQRCGRYPEAIAHHEAGLAITREGVDPLREAQSLVNYAETLSAAGDQEAAIARAQESLAISRRHQHNRGAGLALRLLGDAHAKLGSPDAARRCWQEALVLLDGLDHAAHAALVTALGISD